MKYSITAKFVAVALCAGMLLMTVAAAVAVYTMEETGILAGKTADEYFSEPGNDSFRSFAQLALSCWASTEFGDMPQEIGQARVWDRMQYVFLDDRIAYEICKGGSTLYTYGVPEGMGKFYSFQPLTYERYYPDMSELDPVDGSWTGRGVYDPVNGAFYNYYASYEQLSEPDLEIVLYADRDDLLHGGIMDLLYILEYFKNWFFVALVCGLLLFAVSTVYLCCAAGHRPGSEEIRAAGLNAVPLDLWFLGGCIVAGICGATIGEVDTWLVEQNWKIMVCVVGFLGYVSCLSAVGFCFACVAQIKMGGGYWFRNSFCGRCIKLAVRAGKWGIHTLRRLLPHVLRFLHSFWALVLRLTRDAWKICLAMLSIGWNIAARTGKWLMAKAAWLARRAERTFSLLPLTWQWLLVGFGLLFMMGIAGAAFAAGMQMLSLGVGLAVVIYGANSFGTLLEAVRKMRSGDLETKADSKYLVGSFREFSEELNGLADVAMVAAQKQLKSERMKTELITNVSHDIKTPLTSIINYVDLLEKPHTPEEEKVYLEVLHRQSQRMKKLIEDLMEMSKASTGNIPVEIACIDAVEAVNQAMGEFADKLTAAGLTPVFRQPEEPVWLLADGRLLWRAMSNVLSNAVKYALPGTRLYVDVAYVEDKAVISFKNISGAQLNISADELMERFVRGDSSRNTEGSGLGLNIAKSLMELQKGQLQLLVDGDLFKVTLVFRTPDSGEEA